MKITRKKITKAFQKVNINNLGENARKFVINWLNPLTKTDKEHDIDFFSNRFSKEDKVGKIAISKFIKNCENEIKLIIETNLTNQIPIRVKKNVKKIKDKVIMKIPTNIKEKSIKLRGISNPHFKIIGGFAFTGIGFYVSNKISKEIKFKKKKALKDHLEETLFMESEDSNHICEQLILEIQRGKLLESNITQIYEKHLELFGGKYPKLLSQLIKYDISTVKAFNDLRVTPGIRVKNMDFITPQFIIRFNDQLILPLHILLELDKIQYFFPSRGSNNSDIQAINKEYIPQIAFENTNRDSNHSSLDKLYRKIVAANLALTELIMIGITGRLCGNAETVSGGHASRMYNRHNVPMRFHDLIEKMDQNVSMKHFNFVKIVGTPSERIKGDNLWIVFKYCRYLGGIVHSAGFSDLVFTNSLGERKVVHSKGFELFVSLLNKLVLNNSQITDNRSYPSFKGNIYNWFQQHTISQDFPNWLVMEKIDFTKFILKAKLKNSPYESVDDFLGKKSNRLKLFKNRDPNKQESIVNWLEKLQGIYNIECQEGKNVIGDQITATSLNSSVQRKIYKASFAAIDFLTGNKNVQIYAGSTERASKKYSRTWTELQSEYNLYLQEFYLRMLGMDRYCVLFENVDHFNDFIYKHSKNLFTQRKLPIHLFGGNSPSYYRMNLFKDPTAFSYQYEIGNSIELIAAKFKDQGKDNSIFVKKQISSTFTPSGQKFKRLLDFQNNHELIGMISKLKVDEQGKINPTKSSDKYYVVLGRGKLQSICQTPNFKVYRCNQGTFIKPDELVQLGASAQGKYLIWVEYLDEGDGTSSGREYHMEKIQSAWGNFFACQPKISIVKSQDAWQDYALCDNFENFGISVPNSKFQGRLNPLMTAEIYRLFNQIQRLKNDVDYIEVIQNLDVYDQELNSFIDQNLGSILSWWNPQINQPVVIETRSKMEINVQIENGLNLEQKRQVYNWLKICNGVNPKTNNVERFEWNFEKYLLDADKKMKRIPKSIVIDMRLFYLMMIRSWENLVRRNLSSKTLLYNKEKSRWNGSVCEKSSNKYLVDYLKDESNKQFLNDLYGKPVSLDIFGDMMYYLLTNRINQFEWFHPSEWS
ncbi:hypothetical protein NEF87_003819 [Candidatus Lokiarchaeum ossiferum]|uniref:Uncharacterized protein n=1 Tax=Candidatus Lokiarchaeum ossiferum TaxID=2951803 RepID=A0ABY6HYL7_9ARCH|nr:hypothetical protein NEF87_003819 [Candidatus Lokiarchaeum sp. B-35]